MTVLHNVPRQMTLFVALLLLFSASSLWAFETFVGRVVHVMDGDTIKVLRDDTPVSIRLYGIDAPEKKQAFGPQAKAYIEQTTLQQIVCVVVHNPDRYGRLVAEVWLYKSECPGIVPDLSQILVRSGLVWWYQQYAPKDTALAQLEVGARAAKLGLWQEVSPIPPWVYRRQRKHTTVTVNAKAD